MTVVTLHLAVGIVVAALVLLAVWQRSGRRITLYVVTLQILIGIVLMLRGSRISAVHPALAVLGWGGLMAANAIARRSATARTVLVVSAVSALLILGAFAIGLMVYGARHVSH